MSAMRRLVSAERTQDLSRRLNSRGLSTSRQAYKSQIPGINTLLVANRGEIAVRVMRTAKRLGIETVAIYSDADADGLHVRTADKAYRVGPAPSDQSYLLMDKIFDAIKAHNVDAVHPGYGFLSTRSEFSAALEKRGIKFLGPKEHAIEIMGEKKNSRIASAKAGVNQIPGANKIVETPEEALATAKVCGYPVMVLAVHGGGGKGMRRCETDDQVVEAFHACKGEAKAFGNQDLMVRKYIEGATRHIEIQVLADQHGNCIYLNERECSIQRRNQKVIEEAPSPYVTPEMRKQMGEQAVALAKAVGYESAGTVEFLVDGHRNFYFLEMNTRLQVEHPITECITGIDIVEQQIRIAAGLPLSVTQADVKINGHAIEARVYAEDSVNFMPSIGQLTTYREPKPSCDGAWVKRSTPRSTWPDVRVDSGVEESSFISIYYDPMISKLVTYGETREHAIKLMENALDNYVIEGLKHNVPILRDIMRQPRFVSGDTTTLFLPEVYPPPGRFQGYKLSETESNQLVAAAAYMFAVRNARDQKLFSQPSSSGSSCSSSSSSCPKSLAVTFQGKTVNLEVTTFTENQTDSEHNMHVSIEGGEPMAVVSRWAPGDVIFAGSVGGQQTTIQALGRDGQKLRLVFCGSELVVSVRSPASQAHFAHFLDIVDGVNSNSVDTVMPGVIVKTNVVVGDHVVAGQALAAIESMKMENLMLSPRDGIVKAVNYKAGDTVGNGAVIIELVEVNADVVETTTSGTFTKSNFRKGDKVIAGQVLGVIESQGHPPSVFLARRDGVVKSVNVKLGAEVGVGDVIMELEPKNPQKN